MKLSVITLSAGGFMQVDDDLEDLQCPACSWSGEVEDFDHVRIHGCVLIHCPCCDANLGSRENVLAQAA